ncbi:MAG: hypothetical protein ACJAZJ_001462, partial [Candidatus Endobugula sp.]
MTLKGLHLIRQVTAYQTYVCPRSLSDLGDRSEAVRDRGHFSDHLRRIVSLFYENDRENVPIS